MQARGNKINMKHEKLPDRDKLCPASILKG